MKPKATLVSLLSSAMAAIALSSSGASAESSNYPGDLTKGKHLTIYVEGLADPSSGFFRVLNNGAQQAGKDLGVDVKYVYPGSVDLASYSEKIEETIAAKPDGILILGIGDLDAVAKEPTAALAVRQTQQVLDQVRRARDAGQAVILITHNLQQAMSVADEVVVLARGRVMGQFSSADADLERVTQLVAQG